MQTKMQGSVHVHAQKVINMHNNHLIVHPETSKETTILVVIIMMSKTWIPAHKL